MRWLAALPLLALAGCQTPATTTARPDATAGTAASSAAARPARRPAAPPVWRAVQAGTTGCAEAGALRQVRQEAVGAEALRNLAAARAAGGCITVFPAQEWRLVERGEMLVRLAPVTAAGQPSGAPLWFWRDQVAEDR